MDKMTDYLAKLANGLDLKGKMACADTIDDLIANSSVIKVAQYVGVIGYVLKQNRAMGNCVRKKRVASSASVSMQEVVLECLKEYQDGNNQYGNNDWTSKYAQAVEQCPESFESSHMEFLEAVSQENDIDKHIEKVKLAYNSLKEAGIEDPFLTSVYNDTNSLENALKEADGRHRPFKVAAPPASQRSNWSRLRNWRPSGQRNQDKDAQLEMANILDGIMGISQLTQRVKTSINGLKQTVRQMNDPQLSARVNNLNAEDWNSTLSHITDMIKEFSLNRQDQSNDPMNNFTNNIQGIGQDLKAIGAHINDIQENMHNLRFRDPIRGTKERAASTKQYEELNQALSKLYHNPLDSRAGMYAQRTHSRLEQHLDNFELADDNRDFQEWANQPNVSEIPEANTPEANVPGSAGNEMSFSPEVKDDILNRLQHLADKYKGDEDIQGLVTYFMGGGPLDPSAPKETPVAANPIAEQPIAEQPIAEPPVAEPIAEPPVVESPPEVTPTSTTEVAPTSMFNNLDNSEFKTLMDVLEIDPEDSADLLHQKLLNIFDSKEEKPLNNKDYETAMEALGNIDNASVNRLYQKLLDRSRRAALIENLTKMADTVDVIDKDAGKKMDQYLAEYIQGSNPAESLAKMADVADTVDKSLGDIIDQYIAENTQEEDETPKFPENASILKEEYV